MKKIFILAALGLNLAGCASIQAQHERWVAVRDAERPCVANLGSTSRTNGMSDFDSPCVARK